MAASTKKAFELFVAKVPWTIAHKEMREYFGQFGQLKKCMLVLDKETGFHKGFGWVSYVAEESLNNALQTEPHILEGAKLQVQRNRRQFNTTQNNSKDTEYE